MHTYMHTYMHTCTHTYIHTYTYAGLVFFGSALVFAGRVQAGASNRPPCAGANGEGGREGREEDSGDKEGEWLAVQGLLRAWALDQLAFCYAFVGEAEAALSVTNSQKYSIYGDFSLHISATRSWASQRQLLSALILKSNL
jgi:hypothetical protein